MPKDILQVKGKGADNPAILNSPIHTSRKGWLM